MNEKQYNDLIKNELEKNEDSFYSGIPMNKQKTWELIEYRLEKKKLIPLWFYYAVASLILLFGFNIFFSQKLNLKEKEIAGLKQQINILTKEKSKQVSQYIYQTDTVHIIKKQLVYVPEKQIKTIVVHDTITQLFVQTDTVYIEKQETELIASENSNLLNNQTDIEIQDTPKLKRKKRRNFIIRIGKPPLINPNEKNLASPLLSFKSGRGN